MTGPVVLSSTIRTNLLQQSKDLGDVSANAANETLDPAQTAKIQKIEDSFTTTTLNAQASELGQSLDTISQGLKILNKTQDALGGLADLLRQASELIRGETDPVKLLSAFTENTKAINDFIQASEYSGVNLLEGDEITIITNDSADPIVIEGRHYHSEDLGFENLTLAKPEDVEALREALRFALDSVQNYSVLIRDYINTIQTRQDFTQNTIDVLNEAVEGYDIQDLNEEGVNLLALQTRLQLSSENVSLASEEQNSLLKLF